MPCLLVRRHVRFFEDITQVAPHLRCLFLLQLSPRHFLRLLRFSEPPEALDHQGPQLKPLKNLQRALIGIERQEALADHLFESHVRWVVHVKKETQPIDRWRGGVVELFSEHLVGSGGRG